MFDVRFYVDSKGRKLALEWLDTLPNFARAKGVLRLKYLEQEGNQLHRPYADYLRDGIYELRWDHRRVQYRILYFFKGKQIVIISHGITKYDKVPDSEIDLAILRKSEVEQTGI